MIIIYKNDSNWHKIFAIHFEIHFAIIGTLLNGILNLSKEMIRVLQFMSKVDVLFIYFMLFITFPKRGIIRASNKWHT